MNQRFGSWRGWVVAVVLAVSACGPGFQPRRFANPEELFRASRQEFERGKYENAVTGFERLSLDLGARDMLLAPTLFYLAQAHERRKEFLLAAQAYARLSDGFPEDSLAPRAMLGEGRSYQRLWRKPELDSEYGSRAIATLRILLTVFPEAAEAEEAKTRIASLEDWLAQKDYEIGMHYVRTRKAYDSALIYFNDVVETYPNTPTAKKAWLAIVESYRLKKWNEEAEETCVEVRKRYPDDAEALDACGKAPAESAPTVVGAAR